MKKVPIILNTSNALRSLGSLYRNPADAIKEHVSNAIDEHVKAHANGVARAARCDVHFDIQKNKVVVEYPYGMTKDEIEDALQRVADSAKKHLNLRLIGQLGIGIFSFLQIGKKCVIYSKKGKGHEHVKVTLRDGSDTAEFESPRKREGLDGHGIRIVITDLLFDPTKPRGPLSPPRLQRVFAERFDKFLRDGTLDIDVRFAGETHRIAPRKIDLPRVGEAYSRWRIAEDPEKTFEMELYFDPTGRGRVGIRHRGVVVVEDIRRVDAYGLEESVYAGGHVRGNIDADFLQPLPARAGFEENEAWVALLGELDRLRPAIEAEMEALRHEVAADKLAEVQRRAVEVAREILDEERFGDLELLDGLGRKKRAPRVPPRGFDFVPASLRVEYGKRATLTFKALVPEMVGDRSMVRFHTSSTAIELGVEAALLSEADANTLGVVTIKVPVTARGIAPEPVVVTAVCGDRRAEARVRIARFKLSTPREPLTGTQGRGSGINYTETAFEDGAVRHSRYVGRVVEINELNEDYKREVLQGDGKAALAYAALLIGKETIAFNDKSGMADEYLEKMISFLFRLRDRVESAPRGGRGSRSRGA
jgi:hypothetical protein